MGTDASAQHGKKSTVQADVASISPSCVLVNCMCACSVFWHSPASMLRRRTMARADASKPVAACCFCIAIDSKIRALYRQNNILSKSKYIYIHIHIHLHLHLYIYTSMYVNNPTSTVQTSRRLSHPTLSSLFQAFRSRAPKDAVHIRLHILLSDLHAHLTHHMSKHAKRPLY